MRGERLTICCVLSTSAFVKSVPEILAPPRSLLHVSAQHQLFSAQPDAMLCGLVEHCMFCAWNAHPRHCACAQPVLMCADSLLQAWH